ncbi:MAG: hypothetical protein KBA75_00610 [Alphaproteobacteria bacterium]|nr:hypothetical protein [Alphaproteobacteria bacterium]
MSDDKTNAFAHYQFAQSLLEALQQAGAELSEPKKIIPGGPLFLEISVQRTADETVGGIYRAGMRHSLGLYPPNQFHTSMRVPWLSGQEHRGHMGDVTNPDDVRLFVETVKRRLNKQPKPRPLER